MYKVLASSFCILMSLFVSFSAFADKDSDKGRLDDCYLDAMEIAKEMNAANMHQDADAPRWNQKYLDKKARCNAQQSAYEKKYGAYKLPTPAKPKFTKADKDRSLDAKRLTICNARYNLVQAKFPRKGDVDDDEVKEANGELAKFRTDYKKSGGKPFDEDSRCGPMEESREELDANLSLMRGRVNTYVLTESDVGNRICSYQKEIDDPQSTSEWHVMDDKRQISGLLPFYKHRFKKEFNLEDCKTK